MRHFKTYIAIVVFLVLAFNAIGQSYHVSLKESVLEEKYDYAKFWIDMGADINYVDEDKGSILHNAVATGNKGMVEWLIENGADVNIKTDFNITPLMLAGYMGSLRICHLLYINGADINIIDANDNKASDYAKKEEYIRVTNFLIDPETYTEEEDLFELLSRIADVNNPDVYDWDKLVEKAKLELSFNKFRQFSFYAVNAYFENNENEKGNLLADYILDNIDISSESLNDELIEYINDLAVLLKKNDELVKSVTLLKNIIKQQKELTGDTNDNYVLSIDNLAFIYLQLGEYDKAEKLYTEALSIVKEILGENHPNYVIKLNNLALVYSILGKYDKAEKLYTEALSIVKEIFGDKHPNYAESLNNLASLYSDLEKYDKSEKLYLESLSITKEISGEKHPDYALSLNRLALVYEYRRLYDEAERLYLESLSIIKETLGENHLDYASLLNNLASVYEYQGLYDETESLSLEALSIKKEILGEKHPEYALSLNNLASVYENQGLYDKAEKLYLKCISIRKEVLGEKHPAYASSLNNLASVYNNQGLYDKSEKLHLESLSIIKEALGEKHPDYVSSLNNLASIYAVQGNYEKAENILNKSILIIEDIYGKYHTQYTVTLNNLALTLHLYDRNKAAKLLLEAISINKIILGVNHPNYAASLNNLAYICLEVGLIEEAEKLNLEALSIRLDVYGNKHPKYSESLHNLALVYIHKGKYIEAYQLLNESLVITNNNSEGLNLNFNLTLRKDLAMVSELIGNINKSFSYHKEWFQMGKDLTNNRFSYQSDIERSSQWLGLDYLFEDFIPSFAFRQSNEYTEVAGLSYENTLFTKGLLLNTGVQIKNSILQSKDLDLIEKYNQHKNLRQHIDIIQLNPLSEQDKIAELEEEADRLDKELVRKSQSYRDGKEISTISWLDIRQKLNYNEAAIEFVSFYYHNGKEYTNSTLYYALVLRNDYANPQLVPLFDQNQLDSLLEQSTTQDQLYTHRASHRRNDVVKEINYGEQLFNLVWKPLENNLEGIENIYYSPAGSLHNIAFSAIPIDSTQLLSGKYNLHQLTSTREIVKKKENKIENLNISLFGGIEYELTDTLAQVIPDNKNPNLISTRTFFDIDSTITRNGFNFLHGTGEEVRAIESAFKDKGITANLFTGKDANEINFKNLSNNNIIHIATHGFFLPIEKVKHDNLGFIGMDETRMNRIYQNPLLRSGLAMYGANRAWSGETIPNDWEDGILTAQEISELNLTQTELVVLSACDTGLGDVVGSEGVYGLQRAFKMAGVQSLIVSLWKVPDRETSQMMQSFYNYWINGMTKNEAFKKAQNEIREKNPNPYYWAAFVLID